MGALLSLNGDTSSYVGQLVRRIRRRYTLINGGNQVYRATGGRDSSILAN